MRSHEFNRNHAVLRRVVEDITQVRDDTFVINLNKFQTGDLSVGQLPGVNVRVRRFVLRLEVRAQIKGDLEGGLYSNPRVVSAQIICEGPSVGDVDARRSLP